MRQRNTNSCLIINLWNTRLRKYCQNKMEIVSIQPTKWSFLLNCSVLSLSYTCMVVNAFEMKSNATDWHIVWNEEDRHKWDGWFLPKMKIFTAWYEWWETIPTVAGVQIWLLNSRDKFITGWFSSHSNFLLLVTLAIIIRPRINENNFTRRRNACLFKSCFHCRTPIQMEFLVTSYPGMKLF